MALSRVAILAVALAFVVTSLANPIENSPVKTDKRLVPLESNSAVKTDSIEKLVPLGSMDLLRIVESSHVVVKRSKRGGGIINGGSNPCPFDYGMTPSLECAPCGTQKLKGCPDIEDDPDDYDNEE